MKIDYDHVRNAHGLDGPKTALPILFENVMPLSVLDVGCGTGTWLRAALHAGISDVFGIDGVSIPPEQLLIPRQKFAVSNLSEPIDLGRKFDVAICLEVAEHLDAENELILIDTLTRHSDTIIFSAAAPGQPGQHHVNCKPPSFWQAHFNSRAFYCDDTVRWRLWNENRIEPWYRQNIFMARRSADLASKEPRIKLVIHPDMLDTLAWGERQRIEAGALPTSWYLKTIAKVFLNKVR